MAREKPGWGYDRIVGALANLGHQISDLFLLCVRQRRKARSAVDSDSAVYSDPTGVLDEYFDFAGSGR